MHQMTLAEIARGLADKKFSSEELTKTLLARIAQLDPQLNSFITLTEDLALEQAKAADARRANGETGALLGAPIGHKDLFCTLGVRTSCGSKMLDKVQSSWARPTWTSLRWARPTNRATTAPSKTRGTLSTCPAVRPEGRPPQ